SSGTELGEHDTSSRLGNDAHADVADIRPIYNEEPMAEVGGWKVYGDGFEAADEGGCCGGGGGYGG
nr:hypothetical protein [Tanacetum cinerariifolium]